MKIGILSFRSTSRKLTVEEQRLVRAAESFGHETLLIHAMDCVLKVSGKEKTVLWKGQAFPRVDVLIPRARFVDHPDLRLTILQELEQQGIPVLNSSRAILAAKNKVKTLQILQEADLPIPRSMVIEDLAGIKAACSFLGLPLIVKNPFGTYGYGVYLAHTESQLRKILHQVWRKTPLALLQEFLSESEGKDTRVFVVAGKVIGSMRRQAAEGEFRSNVELGGSAKLVEVSKKERKLALQAVKAFGLDFAGVDLIQSCRGPLILEVNANPGFKALERVSGKDIARAIVEAAIVASRFDPRVRMLSLLQRS